MAKILIVVMNSVNFDPRVRRQAAALRGRGHAVHIVGKKDAAHPETHEVWENGVTIERTGKAPKPRRAPAAPPPAPAPPALGVGGHPPVRRLVGTNMGWLPRPLFAMFYEGKAWGRKRWKLVLVDERRLARLVAAHQPDVIHAHDMPALPIAVRASRLARVPLIFDAHEIYDQIGDESRKSDINRQKTVHTLTRFSSSINEFVTINDSIAQYYAQHYPRLPRATVISNANSPSPQLNYDGRLHRTLNIAENQKIILYQGGFSPRRNLMELVQSAEHLKTPWVLVFMGWGPLESHLKEARAALPPAAQQRVHFLKRVPHAELLDWTSGATIGVIPYPNDNLNHWYCTPNKLWEFPQAKVPILASPFPEMRRRIETFGHGWLLTDPFDPKQMAELVNGLDDLALQRARGACERFNATDNWGVYEDRLFALYDGLLGAGRARPARPEAAVPA